MSNFNAQKLLQEPSSVLSETTEHSLQALEPRYLSALTSQGNSCSSNEDSNMSQISIISGNSHQEERPRTARKHTNANFPGVKRLEPTKYLKVRFGQ